MKTILLIRKRSSQLRHILLSLLLLTFIYPASVFAQDVKEEWARRYRGEVLNANTTVHLAVDKDGNSYVTGNSTTSGSRYTHIVTAKYSPEGEELWAVRYFSGFTAEVNDIAVDANGDVYIVGSDDHYLLSRGDDMVIKYDGKNGAQLWRTLNLIRGNSRGSKILVDNMGGVFVVGHTSISIIRYSLIKLNTSDGSVVWSNYLTRTGSAENPSNNLLRFFDFELDGAGDVYVTGMFRESALATIQEIVTLKYRGTDGETIWVQNYDGTKYREVTGLAVDDSGGVFISGSTTGSAEGFLIKYQASDGEQLWSRSIPKNDSPILTNNNIATDNAGGVYSGGAIDGVNYVIRYSAETGATEWQTAFEGAIRKLVTDKTGGVYAAGSSSSAEYHISKYEAVTGKLIWQHMSENDGNYYTDEVTDIRISSSGIHIVGLGVTVDDRLKMFVAKHQPSDGAQLWKNRIQGLQTRDFARNIITDREGNSYITGTNITPNQSGVPSSSFITIVKYSPTGEELWSTVFGFNISDIAVDDAGGVYAAGLVPTGEAHTEVLLRKYNASDGSIAWELDTLYDKASSGVSILPDKQGGIYVKGNSLPLIVSESTTFLAKYNTTDGSLIWGRSFTATVDTSDLNTISDFVFDTAGDVYLTGAIGYPLPEQDLVVVKYSGADGQLVWRKIYDSSLSDAGLEIKVDKEAAYVAGRSSKLIAPMPLHSAFIIKYNIVNGEELWFQPIVDDLEAITDINDLKVSNDEIYFIGIREIYRNPTQYYLMSYSTLVGEQNWTTPMVGIVSDIEVDLLGGIYVTGTEVTEKYSGINGQLLWSVPISTNTDMVDLALDRNLNVFVTGTTLSESSGLDFLTIKYSQQGDLPCFSPLSVQLSLPPHAVRVGEQVLTTADFGDYVPGEAHNIRWEWGDQSQPTIAYFSAGDSHITGEHTYTSAGIYRVSLDFSQSCLVPESYDFEEWLVIYDPAAGSVTGGGQLLSLQTQLPWMSQQQNAQFSFNVKYNQNRDTTPQGQTQLNLREQGVFRSNSIEWLVVRGNQALWQGTGTLNGQGNYGFVASVWDGRGTGADDAADELRIRIWDKNAGNALVYDNFETAGDIYDMTNPTSRIVRGQIIIHPFATASKIASKQETLYNYPNTFRDKTTVTFTADKSDTYRLEVYDMRGKLVKQLWQGQATIGQSYSVELDGTAWPKGIYVTRLVSSTGSQSIKMLLER